MKSNANSLFANDILKVTPARITVLKTYISFQSLLIDMMLIYKS